VCGGSLKRFAIFFVAMFPFSGYLSLQFPISGEKD